MPEVFDGKKKMIYTKIVGVTSEIAKATLEDPNGLKWDLQYELGKPQFNINGKYVRAKSIIFTINGQIYDRKTMSLSMFSVVDVCMKLMHSRQNILRYMHLYPEKVSNVYRDQNPGNVNAIIEITNHDNSIYKLHVLLGKFEYSKYADTLKKLNKLTEWKVTGVDANIQNPMISLGLNIGIQIFDNLGE